MNIGKSLLTSSVLLTGHGAIAARLQGVVGDVGVDAAQGYLAKADCDGSQFREISIKLTIDSAASAAVYAKLVCGIALHQKLGAA